MKQTNQNLLLTAGAGLLGLLLRVLLYRTGFDGKGILSASNPLHLICLGLTAAMAVYLFFRVRRTAGSAENHTLRLPAGVLAGVLLLLYGIGQLTALSGPLTALRCALALAGALAMVLSVCIRVRSGTMHMVCHGLICVFFALDMLCRYRGWSGNPQLPDYCFHVLAGVCLSLCSYHRLALDTGLGKHRSHSFACLMALYLCLLCLAGPESREFYLGGALWAAACLFTPEKEEPHVSA